MIPFVDLKANYAGIKEEVLEATNKVFDNTAFILGENVERFEKNFAAYCGVKHAVGVNSGTAALHVALLALGIGVGDEVITVPNSFFATAEAISNAGATPTFVDVDEQTYTLDPSKIEEAITEKTKAIIPVQLYGQTCDMDPIREIAERHSLKIVEDACQAHGAEYNGKKTGSLGDVGCFSFYPAKNLGAFGEGGMLTTDDDAVAEKARLYRAHGEKPKNTHTVVGYNFRMAGLQGAILDVKLKYLDQWNDARRAHAKEYTELLSDQTDLVLPTEAPYAKHVYHLYVVQHEQRDKLRNFLGTKEIATGVHYTTSIHLQPAYAHLNYKKGDFQIAEKIMQHIVSLPMYPELASEQIQQVVAATRENSNA